MKIGSCLKDYQTILYIFREELERLKQEHLRAEEQRQLKEEELWKTHDLHLQEIEEEKKRLTKLKEETFIQRQKADQELQYARECLAKEQEACKLTMFPT